MLTFFHIILWTGMVLLCLFMILIILLQRGKGGGLVGAFGGLGGSSAFGAKTGDVFLKVTIVSAIIWFVLCVGGRYLLDAKSSKSSLVSGTRAPAEAPADAAATDAAPAPAADVPAADAPAADTPAAGAPAAPATDAAPAADAPAADAAPAEAPAEAPAQ